MRIYFSALSSFAVLMLLLISQSLYAEVWDDPKNLQVLPKDISPDDLRKTMLSFSSGLNARCSYCHMVDDQLQMPDPDFSDDEKWTKRAAREMLRMRNDINRQISNIEHLPDRAQIQVECITCHRGQYRPQLILSVLSDTMTQSGVDAVITKYTELYDRYYGNHTYDLRASTLAGFARGLAAEDNVDSALKLLNFADSKFPDTERVLFALSRVYQQQGDTQKEIGYLSRLVDMFPESTFYAKQLTLAKAK